MLKDRLFIALFILIALIASLHILAIEFYLYWLLPWFDILVHFLAGLWVGLLSLWIYFRAGLFKNPVQNIWRASLVAASSIIIIGTVWEFYEIIIGIPIEEDYIEDTIIDIVMDVLGMLVGLIYYVRVYLVSKTKST